LILPLTHLVKMCRYLGWGRYDLSLLGEVGYFLIMLLIFYPMAIAGMRRRLLK
jgi:hypothetical protein